MKQVIILLALLNFLIQEARGQADGKQQEKEILIDPEKIASFPGGNDSLTSFINKNLINSEQQKKGKVFVAFFVNVDGTLSDIKIEKGLTSECDMEVLRLIGKMPSWIPGTMYGTPARQRIVLPINFH